MMLLSLVLFLLLLAVRLWGGGFLAGHLETTQIEAFERGLTVALAVTAAMFGDGLFRFFYWHRYWKMQRGRETPALIRDLFTVAVVLLVLSLALWWEEGVSFTGLVTASGATAIILGIALQTVIQDLFSGLSINLEGSYALGDWLTFYSEHLPEPVYGLVTGITWRSTFLELEDGRRMMVPNHMATSNAVLNHSKPRAPKRLHVEIGIDYRVSPERVMAMLLGEAHKVVRGAGMVANPPPGIFVDRVQPGVAFYRVHFYADPHAIRPYQAQSAMNRALLNVVHQNMLPMPTTMIEMAQPLDLSPLLGDPQVRQDLSHTDLFANVLNEEQAAFLAARCKQVEFPVGGVVMNHGEEASTMYIILQGAVRVTVDANGQAEEVAVLAAGDVVGEMSLMSSGRRNATVIALTTLHTLEISRETIAELLRNSPELYRNFSEALARRQAQLDALAKRPNQRTQDAQHFLDRMMKIFSF